MKQSDLRTRIREYENAFRFSVSKRTPVIIRVDGKAFHSLTKKLGFSKPYDKTFMKIMNMTAIKMCDQIQGAKIAYVQSDEITLLLINYEKYNTESWFNNSLQKMCSVSASIATVAFNRYLYDLYNTDISALFDSRIFCVPREEVCNVFIDRQIDCIKNSTLALGQFIIGKNKINGLSCNQIRNILSNEWESLDKNFKYGRTITENGIETMNIFSNNRQFIDKYVWSNNEEGKYSTPCTIKD